ncbi:MAG: hypothetical protein V1909_01570 [Candidatus Micrarchaeota archaeon]
MSQEESQESEKESNGGLFGEFGGLTRWARYGFAGIGVAASFIGLVLVILVYLTLSPSVGTLRDSVLTQIDTATSAVGNLDKSLQGTYESMGAVPDLAENLSAGFEGYATSTNTLADGIDALAEQAALLPGQGSSASTSLKSASTNLRASAGTLGAQAGALASVSSSIMESQQGIKAVRGDLSKAKSDLAKSKQDIGGVFDSLSNALLLGCVMFALVFIALGAYSVALFL